MSHPSFPHDPRDVKGINPAEVNARDNFSLHAVFRRISSLGKDRELSRWAVSEIEKTGVEIRGFYDVSAYRADADLMLWALADSADKLQSAYHALIDTKLGRALQPVWSVMSRHMPAEFNPNHLPACFGGVVPRAYAAVYPFTRSWDWYYLPKEKRGAILKEHGMNGRDFLDVKVSTLGAFALSDYEWSITLEADSLDRIMGVLRQQRDAEARLHVRVDTPFYTGKRVTLDEWVSRHP